MKHGPVFPDPPALIHIPANYLQVLLNQFRILLLSKQSHLRLVLVPLQSALEHH